MSAFRCWAPPLGPRDDQRQGLVQPVHRRGEAAEVLARLERADEEHEAFGETMLLADPLHVADRGRGGVHAERDDAHAGGFDPRRLQVLAARLARGQDERRRAPITSRLRRITRTPCRVNFVGSRRNARSWTVTTRGAAVGQGTSPVAWVTSTGPVARSTVGRRARSHDS